MPDVTLVLKDAVSHLDAAGHSIEHYGASQTGINLEHLRAAIRLAAFVAELDLDGGEYADLSS